MKRFLARREDNSITVIHSLSDPSEQLPAGWSLVANEDLEQAELDLVNKKLNQARELKLNKLRELRAPKLARVDTLVNLAVLNSWTGPEKTELKNYRQELLDMTESYKADMSLVDSLDLSEIEWPEEPSET